MESRPDGTRRLPRAIERVVSRALARACYAPASRTMSTTNDAQHLAALLGAADASPDAIGAAAAALLARRGCGRPPPGADDDADVRHALWWLVRMAERTARRAALPAPAPDPALVARFAELCSARPPRDEEHAQLHVDAASTLRRAEHVRAHLARHPGPVLAVGDDDAVTLALALMGVPELFAVDIDERVLSFLAESAARAGARIETRLVDVLAEPLPAPLVRRCATVIADPVRSLEPTLGFLLFGAAALRRDAPARLFWADHPDWSFEHGEVVEALARAGLRVVETHEDLHAYPLDEAALDLGRVARELDLDEAWLRELATRTSAWSSLYVLERRPPSETQRS